MLNLAFLLPVLLLVEFYTFQAVKQVTDRRFFRWLYLICSALIIAYIAYGFSRFDRSSGQNHQSMLAAAMVILFYLPKVLISILLLLEDFVRVLRGMAHYFKREKIKQKDRFLPERRKFVTQLALGIAALPFLSVLHGITLGRYKFQVHKHILTFEDLPEAFDGFTITQLSDIHSGSFDNREQLEYAIDLVNQQQSDLLLFTGDLVNSLASEMMPWLDVFKKIEQHPYGNFSILGNHDYGEYIKWETDEERIRNFEAICDLSPAIGFKLLRNEHVRLQKGEDSLVVVGVENWGARAHFMKYGDLDLATKGVRPEDFKVLMTHDPSHWEAKVLDHPQQFQLTLSGHTHGSQFGIEIPGFIKWSPIQYVYKQWAGVYEKLGKMIYVNRGFGYHAYQGRTGIWPEITVLELRKKK
ncbi:MULTISPECIES: metallophosphoesterase [unclassified Myroides]|uniref:metallophosphoesterase n=1 Tax=unclassified Myroides TaxID=2642485 RepID=UPI0015F8A199|nr:MULTISPECIES: metallophosphoesterase [unclassified Myroides]MBB1150590.1 metallophosphoesterase [Myroides sp. NP-2]MDM1407179.1 metallophosphoesterase [Myroides sp. DF42-4-2]